MEEMTQNEDMPTIPEFFNGRSIFVTGGTGFMGKVLIEKMLWSCPELKCIYILLRPKKGKDSHQRLIELEKSKVFERLRIKDPNIFFDKVKVISGDVSETGLGLSFEEKQILIDTVSVVYHVAASVRFNDSLKEATFMNTRGCRELMLLCQNLKKIRVIMHVSTAYCNTNYNPIHEKLYPAHADWKKTIEIAESADEYQLQILTEKYISTMANTYVFTKGLAEHVVNDLRGDIPAVIFRPSIVVSSLEEPVPGWLENFNGPVGLLIACGKGILRTIHSDSKVRLDFIPVDMAIKALIIAAWKHGSKKNTESDIPVYNCCSGLVQNVSLNGMVDIGLDVVNVYPLNDIVWVPKLQYTTYKIIHLFRIFMFQLLPALILDLGLKINKQKPRVYKIQRKIYIATTALKFYIDNEFIFKNDNLLSLTSDLSKSDVALFNFNFVNVDAKQFFKIALMGARRYLLNEPDDTIPQAQAHYKRMYIISKIVKGIFWAVILWCLYNSTFTKNIVNELLL